MSTRTSPPAITLRGRWLLLARGVWVTIATLALLLFAASIPAYVFNVLELGQAERIGGPVEAPATLVFAVELLGVLASVTVVLVCLTLAGVLFWRRSDDWMVIFISSYLLLYGTVFAGPLEWAEDFYPAWPTLAVDLIQPLFLTTPTVALIALFPDGRLVPRWTRWLILLSILLVATILYLPLYFWGVLMLLIVLGAIYAQVHRYRHVSTATERQQTKFPPRNPYPRGCTVDFGEDRQSRLRRCEETGIPLPQVPAVRGEEPEDDPLHRGVRQASERPSTIGGMERYGMGRKEPRMVLRP